MANRSSIQFDAVLVGYLHPRKFPLLGPSFKWVLRATTVGVLVGVYQFNTNDIGTLPISVLLRIHPLTFTSLVLGLTELIAKAWHA